MSWDAHLCFEVSDACRLLRFALEALILYLGRSGRVYVHRYLGAELLQLERVVSGYVAVGEIRGRARQAEAVTWSGALWLTAETLLGVLLLD